MLNKKLLTQPFQSDLANTKCPLKSGIQLLDQITVMPLHFQKVCVSSLFIYLMLTTN